jgi:hypothetical protein
VGSASDALTVAVHLILPSRSKTLMHGISTPYLWAYTEKGKPPVARRESLDFAAI